MRNVKSHCHPCVNARPCLFLSLCLLQERAKLASLFHSSQRAAEDEGCGRKGAGAAPRGAGVSAAAPAGFSFGFKL
jgi:hypothetical protein